MSRIIIGDLDTPGSDPSPPPVPPQPVDPSTHYVMGTELQAHISSATPHPAYDDPLGLTTYFENGLV